jgi:hypothetical protein
MHVIGAGTPPYLVVIAVVIQVNSGTPTLYSYYDCCCCTDPRSQTSLCDRLLTFRAVQ